MVVPFAPNFKQNIYDKTLNNVNYISCVFFRMISESPFLQSKRLSQ